MSAPIIINDVPFRSANALVIYTRALLARVGVTHDLEETDRDAHAFVWSLLQRHPRADVKLRDAVRVEINEPMGSTPTKRFYGVWLHYSDGRRDNISALKKCITATD